ncbi:hypothetical protein BG00_13535 [Pseudoalteromonas sp. SCSIO_11900]|uniref:hypothetical protein n=1 Tax=Pseudoalteromonas sp. SCSIO_11900 TaxID=1461766 RepID=UPI00044CB6C9|nr:hypothetical protein [Pseudoalteromonas sp. SCSIO_11900]EWS97476.1 hypothetical protein BG00_13535 [Pseudoalteromonas sp. SCSIO_11900]
MNYVVFLALLLLITLLGSYLLIESNRKKTIEAKKKLFNERVASTQSRLKIKLNELLDAKVISAKHLPRIQAVVSNFFVVQPHTDENLNKLESLCDLLINILNEELIKTYKNNNSQAFSDTTQYFIAELPAQGILYNKNFYQEVLPTLILKLKTEEIAQPIDNIELSDEIPLIDDEKVTLNESRLA